MTDVRENLRTLELIVRQLLVIRTAMVQQEDITNAELALVCDTVAPLGVLSATTTAEVVEALMLEDMSPWRRDGIQARVDELNAQAELVAWDLRDLIRGRLMDQLVRLGVPGFASMPTTEM